MASGDSSVMRNQAGNRILMVYESSVSVSLTTNILASILNVLYVSLSNGAFNNIPYKCMRLTSKVKCFSEKYKRMRLITRLYGIDCNYHIKVVEFV